MIWEYIGMNAHRLRVPLGWIVKGDSEYSASVVFVFDPFHVWKFKKAPKQNPDNDDLPF